MRKRKVFLAFIVIIALLISIPILYNNNEFERLKNKRESVVEMLLTGELVPTNNGVIVLPNDLKSLSDSGECIFVEFQSKKAVYFYSFRGMLDATKGYVFVSEKLQELQYPTMDDCFVNVVEIEENWFKVSTDY